MAARQAQNLLIDAWADEFGAFLGNFGPTTINSEALCKAIAAAQSPLLKGSQAGPNEMKVPWDPAPEYRGCGFNPQNWKQGFVHFVVCDRSGEWVIVDMQSSHRPDYRTVKPSSKADCSKLLLRRRQGYLQ